MKNLFKSRIYVRNSDLTKNGEIKKRVLLSILKIRMISCKYTDIFTFPNLRNLTYLDISGTKIIQVPETLYNLKTLVCALCPYLELIPSLPKLETADCTDCPRVKIKSQKNLEELNCSWCDFADLENMPKLKVLSCNNCPNIKLPKKHNTLEILSCVSCPAATLGLYKSLKYIVCYNSYDIAYNNIYRIYNIDSYKEWIKRSNYIDTAKALCVLSLRTCMPCIPKDVIAFKLKEMLFDINLYQIRTPYPQPITRVGLYHI